jgi:hypothetical protein
LEKNLDHSGNCCHCQDLVCGIDSIAWGEMEAATKPMNSAKLKWRLTKTNYSYIQNISNFRRKPRSQELIGLLNFIYFTKNASTIPHDKIFAQQGLCHDGIA